MRSEPNAKGDAKGIEMGDAKRPKGCDVDTKWDANEVAIARCWDCIFWESEVSPLSKRDGGGVKIKVVLYI